MLYALIAMSFLMPVMTIAAFIIGYNVNAQKKLFVKPKKVMTEDEMLLKKIDSLTVEDF